MVTKIWDLSTQRQSLKYWEETERNGSTKQCIEQEHSAEKMSKVTEKALDFGQGMVIGDESSKEESAGIMKQQV